MYGWRSRIGILLPSVNTTMEPELNTMAPSGVSIHATRMLLAGDFSEDAVTKMEVDTERAARELASAGVDVFAFACTSGSFVQGAGQSATIVERIRNVIPAGRPVFTTSEAVVEALHAVGAKAVAVATPYTDAINQKEKLFLEEMGFAVTCIKGLGLAERRAVYPLTNEPLSLVPLQEPYVAYKLAKEVNTPDADCIFISCTNLRTMEIIEILEDELEKPVITSNQATLAMALKAGGVKRRGIAYGSLFGLL